MTRRTTVLAAVLASAALVLTSACTASTAALPAGPACGHPRVQEVAHVNDATSLTQALSTAVPGEAVVLAPGTYLGHFLATTAGTESAPILLCGGSDSVLEGGANGYTLHLDQADWWEISGLSIHGGEKGLVIDSTSHTTITFLRVAGTAQEAVHLRSTSSHNTLKALHIDHTGQVTPRFGEGIYIGSAKENWCRYTSCDPDRSDDNTITDCVFGPGITAENIDIKEGTTGGTVTGNSFDGAGAAAVDSWVDVKGNDWVIHDNTGVHAPRDGAQVHVRLPGWGRRTTFTANKFRVRSDGYGIRVQPGAPDTTVACNNVVLGPAAGLSNIGCKETR